MPIKNRNIGGEIGVTIKMKETLYNYCLQQGREDFLKEWDVEGNLPLTTQTVSIGSSRNVLWKCSKGHSWYAAPYQRVCYHSGCPICSGKKILPGYNDLATLYPEIVKEWTRDRNLQLVPEKVSPWSHKKVWWLCNRCGYEWEATIKSRTMMKTGCPACAHKVVVKGKNDLATTHPAVSESWNYPKNNPLTPNDVLPGTHKKVWWICEKGHEWMAAVSSRVSGVGCPICAGKIAYPGLNDLKSQYPAIVAEWNYKKNNGAKPEEFTASSNKKAWWICEKGHEYCSIIASRTSGKGCPYCANRKILKGYNNLATTHPTLVSEWHPSKNAGAISDYFAGSSKKAWWTCPQGHEYEAAIQSRALAGTGCPICANKQIIPNENSLQALYPDTAAEWHPTKNGKLTPKEVGVGSNRKVWWICKNGHEWQAKVSERTLKQHLCPYCMNKKVWVGFNDLATTHPEIAAQWYPSMNGEKTPKMFTYGSTFRAWWICEKGHIWKAPISRRAGLQKSRCPFCVGRVNYAQKKYLENIIAEKIEM